MLEKRLTQIPKENLMKDRWYLGRGRCSNFGVWNGKFFLTFDYKFGLPTIKYEAYYEELTGELINHGTFQPFLLLDEGQLADPFGERGWDKHYGKTLVLRISED